MNIIEKLGLMPIKKLKRSPENGFLIEEQETYDLNLVKASPKMLEALIESVIEAEKTFINSYDYWVDDIIIEKWKKIIEKATGKKWEEIEELLE